MIVGRTSAAVLVSGAGVLPVITLPILQPWMQRELPHFGPQLLGVCMTSAFLTSSIVAPMVGRLADAAGMVRSGLLVAGITTVSFVLILTGAPVWLLVLALVLAGSAQSLAMTSSNLIMSSMSGRVPHLATLFGVKQSVVPLVSSAAALGTAALAPLVGYRGVVLAAMLVPAALVMMLACGVPRPLGEAVAADITAGRHPVPALRNLCIVAGFAGFANGAFTTYCVVALVDMGLSPSTAGALFGAAAMAGVASRVAAGWCVDHYAAPPLTLTAVMLAVGALGAGLLAVPSTVTAAVGTLAAYALGWGVPGLMQFSVATGFPSRVGHATGVLWLWTGLGVSSGPLAFYAVYTWIGRPVAWLLVALCWAIASLAAFLGGRVRS